MLTDYDDDPFFLSSKKLQMHLKSGNPNLTFRKSAYETQTAFKTNGCHGHMCTELWKRRVLDEKSKINSLTIFLLL